MKFDLKILYIVAFFAMLAVPVIGMNHKKEYVSEIDNKTLSAFPAFGKEGFTKGVENYIRDRIGGRDEMIMTYTILNDELFHEMVHPAYTYGEDGYIFFKMHENIEFGDYHKEFARMVLKLQNYCEQRNARFYFLFDPEKISVYRRYLPPGVHYDDEWVSSMMNEFDSLGVSYVDNSQYLQELSYEKQIYNKEYDAGHWNDLGCFYGMNHLFARMHKDIPQVTELPSDAFKIGTQTQKSLAVSKFPINEDVPVFQLKNQYKDISSDVSNELEIDPRFPYFHYYINEAEGSSSKPRTLIFQGSYLNSRPQFLISNTSIDVGVHNYQNVLDIDYYFNIFQPEVVIFEAAEYVISDGYFNYERMKNLDLAPALIENGNDAGSAVEKLCRVTDRYPLSMAGIIEEGNSIDKVSIDKVPDGCRYAYLYIDGCVYDLKQDGKGWYSVSVLHGAIRSGKNARLFVVNTDGTKYYMPLHVHRTEEMLGHRISVSDGVQEDDGKYEFQTSVANNRFFYLVFQLYDPQTDTYPHAFAIGNEEGKVRETYTHELSSGTYVINFKANSNLADEMLSYEMYLEKGERYYIEYTIDYFSDTEIKAGGIKFMH